MIKYDIKYSKFLESIGGMKREAWANQCWYLKIVFAQCQLDKKSTVAHFGSYVHNRDQDYGGSYQTLMKSIGFEGKFVGVDLLDGPGVDIVCDLRKNPEILKEKFPGNFDIIMCTSLIEHEINPGEFLGLVSKCLKPNGLLIITCPGNHRAHGTVGVYGHYQNLMPDFVYYHSRKAGLEVLPESFLYIMDYEGTIYSPASARYHETPADAPLVKDARDSDVDFLNIPRIKSIKSKLRSEGLFWNVVCSGLFKLLSLLSPTFARIRKNDTVYFSGEMAVCLVKKV